jgi:hypothetical protein
MPVWREEHAAAYLKAWDQYVVASRLMNGASRTFNKLTKQGVEENRAYAIAGVSLADHRSIRAHQAWRMAYGRLLDAINREKTVAALIMRGWARG